MKEEQYTEKEKEVLNMILELSQKTSPVVISLGYVNKEGICRKGLVLKGAPPLIINELVKRDCYLTLEEDGLHVAVIF